MAESFDSPMNSQGNKMWREKCSHRLVAKEQDTGKGGREKIIDESMSRRRS